MDLNMFNDAHRPVCAAANSFVVVCVWVCGCVVVVVCLWLWLPSAARDEALPAESVEAVRKLASDLRCPLLYAEDQVSFTATPTHQPVSHTVDVSFHQ